MSSGFRVDSQGGKDLDDIFDPYQSGTKPSLTGYRAGSQDMRDRYNPLSEGDAAPATQMSVQGVGDLNTLFAAKGTSTQAQVIPFGSYFASSSGSHDAGAGFGLSLSSDGTWAIGMGALQGGTSGTPTSGTWHKSPAAGVGAGYEVRFTAHLSASASGAALPGTYTATTGWLSLSTACSVAAQTDHISSGGSANTGSSSVSGYWYVDIRKVGSAAIRRSTCQINIDAIST